jgi:hypothetical protein
MTKWENLSLSPSTRFSIPQLHRWALFLVFQGVTSAKIYFSTVTYALCMLRTADGQRRLVHDSLTAFDIEMIQDNLSRTMGKHDPKRAPIIHPSDAKFQNLPAPTKALIVLWVQSGLRVGSFSSITHILQLSDRIILHYSSRKRAVEGNFDHLVACNCPDTAFCLLHGPLKPHLNALQLPTKASLLASKMSAIGYTTHSPRRTCCTSLMCAGVDEKVLAAQFDWQVPQVTKLKRIYTQVFSETDNQIHTLFTPNAQIRAYSLGSVSSDNIEEDIGAETLLHTLLHTDTPNPSLPLPPEQPSSSRLARAMELCYS